jgi:hypothetical protein
MIKLKNKLHQWLVIIVLNKYLSNQMKYNKIIIRITNKYLINQLKYNKIINNIKSLKRFSKRLIMIFNKIKKKNSMLDLYNNQEKKFDLNWWECLKVKCKIPLEAILYQKEKFKYKKELLKYYLEKVNIKSIF